MVFTTSPAGVALIKEFEGCKLESYQDVKGVWTIGYGVTVLPNGEPVKPGLLITQDRAEKLFQVTLVHYERHVNRLVTFPEFKQHQFDALVSLTYNWGWGNFAKSKLLKKLNDGDIEGAAEEFKDIIKSGGRVINGLIRRREAERRMFLQVAA